MKIRCLVEIEIDNESEEFETIGRSIFLGKNYTSLNGVHYIRFIPYSWKGLLHKIRNVADDALVMLDMQTQEARGKLDEEHSFAELELDMEALR